MRMTRTDLRRLWRLLNLVENERLAKRFRSMGDGKARYTEDQRRFVLRLVDESGIRATARALGIPRRTIQRWCRICNKLVKRYPPWLPDWAYRRKKRREFWRRRGYS